MPVVEEVKSSWADEVDEIDDLPSSTEIRENGVKIITEYRRNSDGKKEKIVRTYKTEKRIVSKSIAARKTWKKYGNSVNDKPGPNPATTIAAEETFMQFITSKEEADKPDEDVLEKLKGMADKTVKCRTCNGDHWTLKCPYKDTGYVPNRPTVPPVEEKPSTSPVEDKNKPSKYLPPYKRENASKTGDSMGGHHRPHRDEGSAIRISNLSESTQDVDLEELVKPFGDYSKLFLAKDKATGLCKGFAYIHFRNRQSAANAISSLHGHGYDHLILSVGWSKPQNNQH